MSSLVVKVNEGLSEVKPVALVAITVIATVCFNSIAKEVQRRIATATLSLLPPSLSLAGSKKELVQSLAGQIIEEDLPGVPGAARLPATGESVEVLAEAMAKMAARDASRVQSGRVSGTVYIPGPGSCASAATMALGEAHLEVLSLAGRHFLMANPLHPESFPSTRKFESEILAMSAALFGGKAGECVGSVTTGGTESILMAMKAYRDRARAQGMPMGVPLEIVASVATHPAFDKAAAYFDMRVVHTPVNEETGEADVEAIRAAIGPLTVVVVACAPSYPWGIVDDVPAIAAVARAAGVGCHVDACLGGFLLPFVRRLDDENAAAIPPFDFSVPGVTSMSADTHKFGYTTKGTSVVLYSTPELRRYQYFHFTSWSGGTYASPSICGSRPGSLIAACWASMMHLGDEGFMRLAGEVQATATAAVAGLRAIPGIRVLGTPRTMTFAFTTTAESGVNVHSLSSALKARGWQLCAMQFPDALHFCMSARNIGTHTALLADVRECMVAIAAAPHKYTSSAAAVYGLAGSVPAALKDVVISEIADTFLDLLTDPAHLDMARATAETNTH